MRILFAADVMPDPDSGAAGTEWQTIQALRRQGHEVDEIWATDLGRRIRHGNLHYLLELPGAYRRVIGEYCRRNSYDVIHANQGHCYQAARENRRLQRQSVFVCRSHGLDDYADSLLSPWRQELGIRARHGAKRLVGGILDGLLHRHDRLAYRYADGILISSSGEERYLLHQRGIPGERIGRVPQAPADQFVATPAPLMDDQRRFRMLHVGGFAYWKGVHAVASMANDLLHRWDRARLTWVCRGEDHARVRQMLTPTALEKVELLDWMPQSALVDIYDKHGIFLCPSLFEGFGKVFLEAMARGLCVIGTPVGGMPDIIEEGISGMLVDFHSPVAMSEKIKWLWEHAERADSMAVTAAAIARGYSWDRVGHEVVTFYERLIEARKMRRQD